MRGKSNERILLGRETAQTGISTSELIKIAEYNTNKMENLSRYTSERQHRMLRS